MEDLDVISVSERIDKSGDYREQEWCCKNGASWIKFTDQKFHEHRDPEDEKS